MLTIAASEWPLEPSASSHMVKPRPAVFKDGVGADAGVRVVRGRVPTLALNGHPKHDDDDRVVFCHERNSNHPRLWTKQR